jgi:hypothetical protein
VITLTDRPRRPDRATLILHVRFAEHGVAHSVFVWQSRARAVGTRS